MVRLILFTYFCAISVQASGQQKAGGQPPAPVNSIAIQPAKAPVSSPGGKTTLQPPPPIAATKAVKEPQKPPLNYYFYYKIFNLQNLEVGFCFIKIVEDRTAGLITLKRYVKLDNIIAGAKRRFDSVGFLKTDLEGFLNSSDVNSYLDMKWVSRMTVSKEGPTYNRIVQAINSKTVKTIISDSKKIIPESFFYFDNLTTKIKEAKIYDDIKGVILEEPASSLSKKDGFNELNLDYGKKKKDRFVFTNNNEVVEFESCETDIPCLKFKKTPVNEKILNTNPQKDFFDKKI